MSISPFFSGKSDNVDSLAPITSSLSSAHQSLNPTSPNVSPNLIGGNHAAIGHSLQLPTVGTEATTSQNFYHSPNEIFLDGPPVDSTFKISSGSDGTTGLGMPDEELGSLYDFKREQSSQNPYMSGTSASLFSQAALGSRLLDVNRVRERKEGGLDYMSLDAKPKFVLGPSAKGKEEGDIGPEEQEPSVLAKKIFDRNRRDEPTIDAELAAIGIKGIPTIHTACVDGNLRLVKRLTLMRTADVEAKDILGSRPLHVASCYGRRDIISFLLRKGADINAVDNYESTPLVVTADQETVTLLVSFGADIHAKNVNNISAKSISLSNPYFCLAIEQGQKLLRERISATRKFLGQIVGDFIDKDICKHWYAGLKQIKVGVNLAIKVKAEDPPSNGDASVTGRRKRKRGEAQTTSQIKQPKLENSISVASESTVKTEAHMKTKNGGTPEAKSNGNESMKIKIDLAESPKKKANGDAGEVQSSENVIKLQEKSSPEKSSESSEPPRCIADLILSYLYLHEGRNGEAGTKP
uniref:Uncharacterized protein n=1 Tax=Norrisiella sphaerica TaxID=552664 RepID=A0A7S2VUH9_9EUKA|mmetsp:Transcript_1537/g.2147  ORF Transcript_1537/g.2147 Transcript_1537/m.2147 type:complete len:523 (+) Transcript_1537:267-1835(+)|eukprot:CAMPEP_0184479638 /NCGR_PEP_ID=MMETSP0113_2-20130426/1280_1 /TAXON_ID=91329 /ORGANISM="Norrisiella sphaerica, Strain BC52" /LENGTH=522 /DNA_ID=CAMNT_0026857761 /DNA_START=270 /DNA_END=1838 /DNA_ORIENTATION=+